MGATRGSCPLPADVCCLTPSRGGLSLVPRGTQGCDGLSLCSVTPRDSLSVSTCASASAPVSPSPVLVSTLCFCLTLCFCPPVSLSHASVPSYLSASVSVPLCLCLHLFLSPTRHHAHFPVMGRPGLTTSLVWSAPSKLCCRPAVPQCTPAAPVSTALQPSTRPE